MRKIKRVTSKWQDQIPQLICLFLSQAILQTAILETRLLLCHQCAVFFTNCLKNNIGITKRVACNRLEQLHNLFLVNENAIRIGQNWFKNWMKILNIFGIVFVMNI